MNYHRVFYFAFAGVLVIALASILLFSSSVGVGIALAVLLALASVAAIWALKKLEFEYKANIQQVSTAQQFDVSPQKIASYIELLSEVLPVWDRQTELARGQADEAINLLSSQFGSIRDNLIRAIEA